MLRDTERDVYYARLSRNAHNLIQFGQRWSGPFMVRIVKCGDEEQLEIVGLPRRDPFYIVPEDLPE